MGRAGESTDDGPGLHTPSRTRQRPDGAGADDEGDVGPAPTDAGESGVRDRRRMRERAEGETETASGDGRPARAVAQRSGTYDETVRRRKRRREHGQEQADAHYVARSRRAEAVIGGRLAGLKRGIQVGPQTLERIVAARYEWRDAGNREPTAARRRLWGGTRTWDPGRW